MGSTRSARWPILALLCLLVVLLFRTYFRAPASLVQAVSRAHKADGRGGDPSKRRAEQWSAKRRDELLCYMKQRLMTEDGSYDHCCLPEDARHKKCAVISNSGAILGHSPPLGAEIDSFDHVIRLNNAEVKGYEKFVGKSPGYRWGQGDDWSVREMVHLSCWPERVNESLAKDPQLKFWPLRNCDQTAAGGLVNDMYPDKLGFKGKTNITTTGVQGMFIALSSCAEVVAYEMIPSRFTRGAPFHYFGKLRSSKAFRLIKYGWHSTWNAEKDLWARLSEDTLQDIERTGKVRIKGFSEVKNCSKDALDKPFVFRNPYWT